MTSSPQFNNFKKFPRVLISFIRQCLQQEPKINNLQKSEFWKNCFFHDLGCLYVCTKAISKYLHNYFGFGYEEVMLKIK